MANARMIPPGDGRHTTIKINGRTYTCAVGSYIDVATPDAHGLSANGWTRLGDGTCLVGPTSGRPTSGPGGQPLPPELNYIDTTISAVVTWRPPVGATPGAWISTLTGAAA